MAKIEIPFYLLPKLGVEMNSGVHLIDVELRDGRIHRNLVVKGGLYITGRSADHNGEGNLPFSSFDICDIHRHAFAYGKLGAF